MCGIVGYIGQREPRELLLAGLEKLEYRGYDSAGIAVLEPSGIAVTRAVGNLAALREAVAGVPVAAGGAAVAELDVHTGIGHTRWATHGRVTEANAHPHGNNDGRVQVVVNGIIENFAQLKAELAEAGSTFLSETDVEVIAHLVSRAYDGDLVAAVRTAAGRLEGHFAFVAMVDSEPGVLVATRHECPLVFGIGDGETHIASAVPAFLDYTQTVLELDDDELARVTADGVELIGTDGSLIDRAAVTVDWDAETAEKGGFETFMLKEIHDQADAVADTIADRTTRLEGVDRRTLERSTMRC
jgi:glutamine---fructose-6-phosphate transaminase (isomerizing)